MTNRPGGVLSWERKTKEKHHTCQMEKGLDFWVHITGKNQEQDREVAADFNSAWKT